MGVYIFNGYDEWELMLYDILGVLLVTSCLLREEIRC
jgi:hypothetical protein